ncbi:MAG: serine/threonine protein kinase, partial [Actinomycetota bacterium]|nr:serine/threonine protein kinase [Actinomycetota bacterium]
MAATAAGSPSLGLVLGRYRPLRPLGSGGSGSVWLALDERSGVEVALKVVNRDGKAGERAEREALVATRLRHERCQRTYEVASDENHVYIAYEYVPGRNLRQVMRAGELNDAEAVEAAVQVLDALAYAHSRGVVHRDVKPANVLLAEGAQVSVVLLDFGLAQLSGAEPLTAVGDVPGTLAYISPERLRGDNAGTASDVWSVGVVLWEALAGRHPFWAPSLPATARKIKGGAPPLETARRDLPRPLLAAVDRALERDPARRPSAPELAERLSRAVESGTSRHRASRRAAVPRPVSVANVLPRFVPALLAALLAGWAAAAFPFYPAGWPAGLAAAAALITMVRERPGLVFALSVPILPLGNFSRGLALAYLAAALVWLALHARRPRWSLLFAGGALLAPISALGLVPLLVQAAGSPVRRAIQAAAAVLAGTVVCALEDWRLPFSDDQVPPL